MGINRHHHGFPKNNFTIFNNNIEMDYYSFFPSLIVCEKEYYSQRWVYRAQWVM